MDDLPRIDVLYSCHKCGLKDVSLSVLARTTESVVAWTNGIGHAISRDHDRRSPHCHVTSLSEVKIPITGASKIGGPVEN